MSRENTSPSAAERVVLWHPASWHNAWVAAAGQCESVGWPTFPISWEMWDWEEYTKNVLRGLYRSLSHNCQTKAIMGDPSDPGKSAVEWIGGGTAKYFGLKTAVEGSPGTLITLNTSTAIATVPERILTGAGELVLGIGEAAGPYAVGAASLTDLMAHYGCTVAAYPNASMPSPF